MKMVDISKKPVSQREAIAMGKVLMERATFQLIQRNKIPKGDVLTASRLAGINAAKQTHQLIPLCHPLLIDHVTIDFSLNNDPPSVTITATVRGSGKTGFEMEALTAVAIAALTIYDMCKPVDQILHLEDIRLVKKSGGKSGTIIFE